MKDSITVGPLFSQCSLILKLFVPKCIYTSWKRIRKRRTPPPTHTHRARAREMMISISLWPKDSALPCGQFYWNSSEYRGSCPGESLKTKQFAQAPCQWRPRAFSFLWQLTHKARGTRTNQSEKDERKWETKGERGGDGAREILIQSLGYIETCMKPIRREGS